MHGDITQRQRRPKSETTEILGGKRSYHLVTEQSNGARRKGYNHPHSGLTKEVIRLCESGCCDLFENTLVNKHQFSPLKGVVKFL